MYLGQKKVHWDAGSRMQETVITTEKGKNVSKSK